MTGQESTPPTGDEPNEGSLEDVREELSEVERQLYQNGDLPLHADNSGNNLSEEQIRRHWEEFAETLQNALGTVGLFHADDITPERLSKADPDILEKLNPHTAESLYFDTFRKSRRLLGTEPIKLNILIQQARSHKDQGTDLEKLQLLQRAKDLQNLYWAHISPAQLLYLSQGSVGKQQNINRLSFLLFDTPELKEFATSLHEQASEDEPVNIEETVIEAQEILGVHLYKVEELRSRQANNKNLGKRWGYLELESSARKIHRILSAIALGDLILEEMRKDTTLEEFMGGAGPFEE